MLCFRRVTASTVSWGSRSTYCVTVAGRAVSPVADGEAVEAERDQLLALSAKLVAQRNACLEGRALAP
jgi:hypothetical protein